MIRTNKTKKGRNNKLVGRNIIKKKSRRTTIIVATANRGKANEIREIFKNANFNLKFLFDFPELASLNIQENAKSFEGNALIKAIIVGDILGQITLADDIGLCVAALNGRPGVYSARYSIQGNAEANYRKVLTEMIGVAEEDRGCHYHCSIALYDPKTKFVETTTGIWPGRIALEPRGTKSFGYAPIFLAQNFDYKRTNAEFEPDELIMINHRGQAFRQVERILKQYLKNN